MIIQNSTTNFSASRLYQSTHSSHHENSQWNNATGESVTETISDATHVTEYSTSSNGMETNEPIPVYDNICDCFTSMEGDENEDNASIDNVMNQEMKKLIKQQLFSIQCS